jgi:hypothetical protein
MVKTDFEGKSGTVEDDNFGQYCAGQLTKMPRSACRQRGGGTLHDRKIER